MEYKQAQREIDNLQNQILDLKSETSDLMNVKENQGSL